VRIIHEEPHSSCVTALFADRSLSFILPKGATLEDLAGRLASLHVGTPVAINVRLDSWYPIGNELSDLWTGEAGANPSLAGIRLPTSSSPDRRGM
jgi:hypothetical protein